MYIYEQTIKPFDTGMGNELEDIPKEKKGILYALKDMYIGCLTAIYKEVSHGHADFSTETGA